MLRILEISWLALTLISGAVAGYQFFADGLMAALWMLVVTAFSIVMYLVRRRQRIESEK
jgi:hypothetical protein